MSDKLKSQHLARKAILYVRQSSTYQVNHNVESQKLQYAMQQRLEQLGWREIEIIDEDLGRSAAGTVARAGFEPWWPKSAWAKSVRWLRARSRALPATTASGSRWWKSAVWSIPY